MFSLYTVLINSSAVQSTELGNGVRPEDSGGGRWRGRLWRPTSASLPKAVSSITIPVECWVFLVLKIMGKGSLICQTSRFLIYWFCANLYGNFREGQNCCVCSVLNSVLSESVAVFLGHLSLHVKFVW